MWCVYFCFALVLTTFTQSVRADIIGDDDRQEISAAAHRLPELRLEELAAGVAVQISQFDLLGGDAAVVAEQTLPILEESLSSRFGFCPNIRFAKQNAKGRCTAFLASENILITAAHCIAEGTSPGGFAALEKPTCDITRFVFDYRYDRDQLVAKGSDYYKCKEVIRLTDPKKIGPPRVGEGELLDYALVVLDRPVKGRLPLKIGSPSLNGRSFSIAHPYGLPQKFIGNGHLGKGEFNYWLTNLDASEGASGGPIFDVETRSVVGIFKGVTYPKDYLEQAHKTASGCRKYFHFKADQTPTVVISSLRAMALLTPSPSPEKQ